MFFRAVGCKSDRSFFLSDELEVISYEFAKHSKLITSNSSLKFYLRRMNGIFKRLSRPYPSPDGFHNAMTSGIVGMVFVTLFLYFLKPFGTQIEDDEWLLYLATCFQYGMVTFGCALLSGLVVLLFPKIFSEKNWTVGREIAFTIFFIGLIGIGNFVFSHFKLGSPLSWSAFLIWQWMTLVVGFFPTVLGVFWKEISLLRRHASGAAALSKTIENHAFANFSSAETPVLLEGDNQNERLRLLPSQVSHLAAADNYVQVFFQENGEMKNRMLRSTMKKMEEQLAGSPVFYRCHRTFIVNLDKVRRVSGNAQGYRLHLSDLDLAVPVSRALNEEIKLKFASGF